MKNGIVILHFRERAATLKTLCSFDALDEDFAFVVADNDDNPQDWGDELAHANLKHKVTVLKTGGNIGFSRGNNAGIQHLRDRGAQMIVCLNNDVELYCDRLFAPLHEVSASNPTVGIVGFNIVALTGEIQNPHQKQRLSKGTVLYRYFFVHNKRVRYVIGKVKKILKGRRAVQSYTLPHRKSDAEYHAIFSKAEDSCHSYAVHGSALAFLPAYFSHYADGFDERTFLFCEELILGERLRLANLTALFLPAVCILHLEDVSTQKETPEATRRFVLKHEHDSFRLYVRKFRGGLLGTLFGK